MKFFLNQHPQSKKIFETLLDGLEPLTEFEGEAVKEILKSYGIYLEGKPLNDIGLLTFRYVEILSKYSNYPKNSILQHYYTLLAFNLTILMGESVYHNKVELSDPSSLNSPEILRTLRSMDDLHAIHIEGETDYDILVNLCKSYFYTFEALGLRILPAFRMIGNLGGVHLSNLDGLSSTTESDKKHPLCSLDTLSVFRPWYQANNLTPYSMQDVIVESKQENLPLLFESPKEPEPEIPAIWEPGTREESIPSEPEISSDPQEDLEPKVEEPTLQASGITSEVIPVPNFLEFLASGN